MEKVKEVTEESRVDNKDEDLDQEIGRQDLGHEAVVKGQGLNEEVKIRLHQGQDHLEVKEEVVALQGQDQGQDDKGQSHWLKEVNRGQ